MKKRSYDTWNRRDSQLDKIINIRILIVAEIPINDPVLRFNATECDNLGTLAWSTLWGDYQAVRQLCLCTTRFGFPLSVEVEAHVKSFGTIDRVNNIHNRLLYFWNLIMCKALVLSIFLTLAFVSVEPLLHRMWNSDYVLSFILSECSKLSLSMHRIV